MQLELCLCQVADYNNCKFEAYLKTLGLSKSVQSDNKAGAWDLHYTVSWLVRSEDPYILFVLIQWKFVSVKLQYNNSKEEAYMEKLGLMNWALIDICKESLLPIHQLRIQFYMHILKSFSNGGSIKKTVLSQLSENPKF